VLADPLLQPMFEGVDIARLQVHQRSFMNFAFGGGLPASGPGLRQAHAGLVARHGLGNLHFDAVLDHLEAALAAMGVAPVLVAEAMALIETHRREVLGPQA
jgi:hemoglobin